MKHLNEALLESIFDIEGNTDQAIVDSIHKFIKDNYKVKSYTIRNKLAGSKYVVDTRGNVDIKNKHTTTLTNDLFIWGKVDGYFDCSVCNSITDLTGAPKEVKGSFYCNYCDSLTSLEGAPEKVGGDFDCYFCHSLTSLKGAPKEVGGDFYCNRCNSLTSLEGAPKKVGGDFYCNYCDSLISFKGAPEKLGGSFYCKGCISIKDKTIDSKLGGKIYF